MAWVGVAPRFVHSRVEETCPSSLLGDLQSLHRALSPVAISILTLPLYSKHLGSPYTLRMKLCAIYSIIRAHHHASPDPAQRQNISHIFHLKNNVFDSDSPRFNSLLQKLLYTYSDGTSDAYVDPMRLHSDRSQQCYVEVAIPASSSFILMKKMRG